MIVVPGVAGEIGVLARHAPLVATLKAGSTRIHVTENEVVEFATGPGFFKVELDRALALVDDAVNVREIDDERAREQLEAAKAELEKVERASPRRTTGSSSSASGTPRTSSPSPAARPADVRVAALADVHGNAPALAAVLAEVEREAPDLVVFCGDLTWGSLPGETIALVRSLEIPVLFVRGNAERALLELHAGEVAEPTAREQWMLAGARRGGAGVARGFRAHRLGRRRRSRADVLLPRLPALGRGVRDGADSGRARPRVHGGSRRARRRHGSCPSPVRAERRRHPAGQPRQRGPSLRQRRRRVSGRSSGRTWSCAGRTYDVEDAVARMRATDDPKRRGDRRDDADAASRDEMIEFAETNVFAG